MYCAKSKFVELTICPRSCLNVIQGHAIGLAFSSKHASVCYTVKMILFVLDTKTYLWMLVCMHVTVMSICVQFACVHLRFYTWLYYGRYEVSKGKTPSSSLRSNQRAKQCQLLPTQCFHMHNVALKTQTKAQVESKTKGPTLQSPRVHLGCNLCRRMKTQRTCKRKGFPICQSNPAQLRVFFKHCSSICNWEASSFEEAGKTCVNSSSASRQVTKMSGLLSGVSKNNHEEVWDIWGVQEGIPYIQNWWTCGAMWLWKKVQV